MKIYEVIFQDEWNNLYLIGYFKTLDDAIEPLNEQLKQYNVKLKKGDLVEYPSTFGYCFDKDLSELFENNDEVSNLQIRGFILDKEKVLEVINNL